jgi:hypothetical protein
LTGCWNGRVLFSFEEPFWASLGGDLQLKASLAGDAARRGYLARIDVGAGASEPLKALVSRVSTGRFAVVIVGPFLSFDWASYVRTYPQTRFVLVDAPTPALDPPSNAVFLTFDRTRAFQEAGRAAAESIRSMSGARSPTAPVSELGPRIAVLTSDDSGLTVSEMDAFMRGVADSLSGGRPVTRMLSGPQEKISIRAAVDQMRHDGAKIFLFGLGQNDPFGLEALRDGGGSAVVADWEASGAFPAQVLASIEEDVPAGILRALDALREGVAHVDGPVKLVSRKKI